MSVACARSQLPVNEVESTMPLTQTQLQQLSHRSVRRFLSKPLETGQLEELIRCGQGAATSSFIQAYSVVRVTRPEAREAIAAAAGGQAWIEKAAEFLVFCADLNRINAACERAGRGGLDGYSEHGLAAVIDTALMAQNVMLAAESQGLGGVFIGGIRNAPKVIADQLGLPQWVTPLFGMCLGWPDEETEVKPRMPVDMVLHQDHYRETPADRMAEYDECMATYYATRGANVKLSDWTRATANAVQGKTREHMLGFLRSQGFFVR
jgi:nitroreductase